MKIISVFTVVLVILPFNICFGSRLSGSLEPIETNQVNHLKKNIEEYMNSNKNDDDWAYVDEIQSVTAQIIAGTLYRIKFLAVITDCSKNDATNSKKNCNIIENQFCSALIWEKTWENSVKIKNIRCKKA